MVNYYGSDLNKFIGENCPHDFTAINIDCFCLRWATRSIRIIEAKHTNEPLGNQQIKALRFLAKVLNETNYQDWSIDIFITRGNPPYDTLDVLNLFSEKTFRIKGQQSVIDWLSFKSELKEVAEEIPTVQNGVYLKMSI